ncbi:MAG: type IV pilin protein [Woeseiaceae bacterium]|jgi:type IV pilus assembly protein PilE
MNFNNKMLQRGITLLELMIVVAIIAMIAAFAYPSYTQYIVDTKRTAATSTLLQVADRQQQFFMDNKRFTTDMTDLGYQDNPLWVSDDGNRVVAGDADAVYVFGLVNVTPTEFLAFAVPIGQQQIRDSKCGALTLNNARARMAYGTDPDDCW